MKKLLLSTLCCLLAVLGLQAEIKTATLSFASTDYRTAFSTSEQVWENDGIKFTNNKAASTSNVADYSNPVRLYKSSSVKVQHTYVMTKIEFNCNTTAYATELANSVTGATVNEKIVTVEPNAATYTVEKLAAQVRMDSVTVYYNDEQEGGEEPGTGGDGDDTELPTVESLTDFIAAAPSTNTKITGTVTVYYQSPDKKYTFITDGTSNLQVYGSLTNAYNNGDQLTGIVGTMGAYGGMSQMVPDVASFGTATAGTPVQPKAATLAEEIAPCDFVTITGVNITEVNGKNATITDGTNSIAAYDRFAITLTATENATIVAIGAVYNSNKQLYIVSVNGGEQGGGEEPVDPNAKGQKANPYTVEEVIALGNPGTTAQWVTGYIIGVINYDNNSQLEVGASTTVKTCLAIASSASETDKANCVAVQLPNNAIRTALNLVDNPGNLGKQVSVCGSLEKYFGMAGVKNVTDYELGEGGGEEPDPVDPNAKGQENNPYTVEEAIALGNPGTTAQWVTGYIVGVLNSNNNYTFETSAPFGLNSSIMIASSPTETDLTKCFPVQLPAGKIREDLNLMDRPGNLGKEVSVCGDLVAYFNMPGMKNTTNYTIVGGLAPLPVGETESLTTFVEEQFSVNTKITGTVTVYYQSPDKKYTFITDGTTNLEVYAGGGLEHTYVNGDQLTGIIGKFSYYQNMPQFTPQADSFGEPTPGTAVQPVETTLTNVQPADFVMIKNTTITSVTADNKTTITVSDASGSRILFDRFAIGVTDATNVNILGIGAVFGEDAQLFPIEITPATDGINEITTEANGKAAIYDLQGRKLNAPVRGINIINGRKVLVK